MPEKNHYKNAQDFVGKEPDSEAGQDFADLLHFCLSLINDSVLPKVPERLKDIDEVNELHHKISELRTVMLSFSKGDFSGNLRISGSCAGYLKALQANIRHLDWQVRAVAGGDFTQRITFMGELSESFNEMIQQLDSTLKRLTAKEEELLALTAELKQEISTRIKVEKSLRASEAKYRKMAVYDWLTGVHNRRYFMELAQKELGRSLRGNLPMSVAMLDVDHFKQFNDTYGHLNGDACLQHVARIIISSVRRMDVVARFGGEEFVILLPETDLKTAHHVAERMRLALETSPVSLEDGRTAGITASLGVAEVERKEASTDLEGAVMDVISFADRAMYQAKSSGRNQVRAAENSAAVGQEAGAKKTF